MQPRQNIDIALPAHCTKHIPMLTYQNYTLLQLDDGEANGTCLWLGAQCLSLFLAAQAGNIPRSTVASPTVRPKAVEVGSGVGLTACVYITCLHKQKTFQS